MSGRRCGTTSGYQGHMQLREPSCQECRDAQAAWQRAYRIRRYLKRGPVLVDGTGARRRLQALARTGWSLNMLGVELGMTGSAVYRIHEAERVLETTARRVAELYDRLWDKPGGCTRASRNAAAHGWPPPLAWDDDDLDDPQARPYPGPRERAFDEVAVTRAMFGDRVHLRPTERAEATRRLTALGLSAAQIADRLGVTKRSVARQRNPRGQVA